MANVLATDRGSQGSPIPAKLAIEKHEINREMLNTGQTSSSLEDGLDRHIVEAPNMEESPSFATLPTKSGMGGAQVFKPKHMIGAQKFASKY